MTRPVLFSKPFSVGWFFPVPLPPSPPRNGRLLSVLALLKALALAFCERGPFSLMTAFFSGQVRPLSRALFFFGLLRQRLYAASPLTQQPGEPLPFFVDARVVARLDNRRLISPPGLRPYEGYSVFLLFPSPLAKDQFPRADTQPGLWRVPRKNFLLMRGGAGGGFLGGNKPPSFPPLLGALESWRGERKFLSPSPPPSRDVFSKLRFLFCQQPVRFPFIAGEDLYPNQLFFPRA